MDEAQTKIAEWHSLMPDYDQAAATAVETHWAHVAKPLRSLGRLEKAVIKIAALTGNPNYAIDRRVVAVCCADNGVARQGVSKTGSEVTAVLARCLAAKNISVCKMASVTNADMVGIDMGMHVDLGLPELINCRVGPGTGDISAGPAMTVAQAIQGIEYGMGVATQLYEQGYNIVATGEVGIGNTTTSSAMAAVYLGRDPSEVTGPGAGISTDAVARKAEIIRTALATNRPDPADPLDVLAKVGGFDIAGITGIFLGCARHRVPVVVDGIISSIAALTARKLCPGAERAMLASHVSAEPAARWLLQALELEPLICADMCLGEGTGAVAMLPLLDMAYAVYHTMPTYEEIAIGKYQPKV